MVLAAVGAAALGASAFWPGREPSPPWLRRLGLIAFFAVVLQGLLRVAKIPRAVPVAASVLLTIGVVWFFVRLRT